MSDNKFVFTLIGLLVAVFAICNCYASKSSNEGYINYNNMGVKKTRMINDGLTKHMVHTPSNFKPVLAPRFHSGLHGLVKYNMAPDNMLGVPKDPLSFGEMIMNDYDQGHNTACPYCGSSNCTCSQTLETYNSEPVNNDDDSLLPVGTMDAPNGAQHIVYDRSHYAPKRSRNYANGDHLRGDLVIRPNVGCGWFNVAANPEQDLHLGALHVMGGFDYEQAHAMKELISETRTDPVIGGVTMGNQYNTTVGVGSGDVRVRSYV
jgi:hypothetical protein